MCPGYDTEQSDGQAPVMLVFWGMWNTSLLLSLQGPHLTGVVALDKVLSKGLIELNSVRMLNWSETPTPNDEYENFIKALMEAASEWIPTRLGANNAKAQIEYILKNNKWVNGALNCEAYSSFEGGSCNHRIVSAKIHLSLCRNAALTTTTAQ